MINYFIIIFAYKTPQFFVTNTYKIKYYLKLFLNKSNNNNQKSKQKSDDFYPVPIYIRRIMKIIENKSNSSQDSRRKSIYQEIDRVRERQTERVTYLNGLR